MATKADTYEIGPDGPVRAKEIMAQFLVWDFFDTTSSREHRRLLVGNYLLSCMGVLGDTTTEELVDFFTDGLVVYGADPAIVRGPAAQLVEAGIYEFARRHGHLSEEQKNSELFRVEPDQSYDYSRFTQALLDMVSVSN